jgi:hypothetical protein
MRVRRAVVGGLGAMALGVVGTAAPASAATNNTERFLFVNTSATATSYPVSATGPIHALGRDTPIPNTNKDHIVFPAGSITIRHDRTSGTEQFDHRTCTGRFTEQGTYRVLSGSGAYAHATGHGTYSLSGVAIGCSQKQPPSTFSLIISAAGPLNL